MLLLIRKPPTLRVAEKFTTRFSLTLPSPLPRRLT